MVDILGEELNNASNLDIIHQDILEYDFTVPLKGNDHITRIKIIGNIPYGISSQIFFRLIEFRDSISSVVCMFQKEVAERITAVPGTKEYGILSILAAMYTIPSRVMHVPASCFYPRPRVDSSVLKMNVRETPLYQVKDGDIFLKVVKCAFAKRRKTLFNNLRGSDLFPSGTQDVQKILGRVCIDGHRRGETLTVKEFGMLSDAILMDS
jgi:16S rRNA (adenine1518-N6/adenine1519-N6)-dimethyltransferase